MAASPLFDLNSIDLANVLISREQIYQQIPHRHEFMLLDGILYMDQPNLVAVAYRDVREDEWWVRGHIPGRPLFPGVLMVETAAQMAAYFSARLLPGDRFIGFSGLDGVKFRAAVSPPARMYFILKGIEVRPRRIICDTQAWVDGQLAFEGRITGMPV